MKVVKIISSAIEEGFRRIKFQRLGKSDVQSSYQANPFGVDSQPIKDMQAIHAATGEKGESVVLGYINKALAAADGEIRIFSVDSDGALKSYVHVKADGTIEINSGNSTINIVGNLDIDGDLNVQGEVTADDEVTAKNATPAQKVTLSQHKHSTSGYGAPTSTPTPGT